MIAAPAFARADEAATDAVRTEYLATRAKTANTANAQWKLASWCEAQGLKAEALEHFAAVTRLDPKRDAAWKRLGYKKIDGRWLNDAMIAAENETKEAVRKWGRTLSAIHREIHGGRRQLEAEKALHDVTDETAIPAVYHEFGRGGPDQAIAIQVLGQIRGVVSSKTLAYFSIYGSTANVRARATETLRGRDPAEYAEDLVALIADPMKYEVRNVGGPNAPGVLFVEGERFNVRRFYAAPAPNVGFQPGDTIGFDPDGSPALVRPARFVESHGVMGKNPQRVTTSAIESFSLAQIQAEADQSAFAAQSQLQGDIQEIESQNAARASFGRIVMDVLRDATGKDAGKDKKSWKTWLAALKGYVPERE